MAVVPSEASQLLPSATTRAKGKPRKKEMTLQGDQRIIKRGINHIIIKADTGVPGRQDGLLGPWGTGWEGATGHSSGSSAQPAALAR